MALNTRTSVAARNARLDAETALLNNGYLDIYDGTQPTDPDTALGSQNKLARLALSATAFQSASGGVATANAISDDTDADLTGTATWFSLVTSGGVRTIEGSVGTSSANLILGTTSIVQHATVSVTSLTLTAPMQGA